MKTETILRSEMIGRVLAGWKQGTIPAPAPRVEECFAELDVIHAELRVAAGRQDGAHRGFREYSAKRAAASVSLHEWMADVALVARSLPIEKYPAVAERFRMPRSQSYLAQQTSAAAFIKALRMLPEIFAPRGLDEEAIAQAETLIEQIDAANRKKISRVSARIENTAKLMLLSRRGLEIVREIDAVLQRALRATPALLAEWNSLRRVHRPWKKRAAQPPQPIAPANAEDARAEAPTTAVVPAPASAEAPAPDPAGSTTLASRAAESQHYSLG